MTTIRQEIDLLQNAGTSEGAKKGWDTRGRGRKKSPHEEHAKILQKHGFKQVSDPNIEKLGHQSWSRKAPGFYRKGTREQWVSLYKNGNWQHEEGTDVINDGPDAKSLDEHLKSPKQSIDKDYWKK